MRQLRVSGRGARGVAAPAPYKAHSVKIRGVDR